LQASILRKVLEVPEDEKRATRYEGVAGGWTVSRVLDGLRKELVEASKSGDDLAESDELAGAVMRALEGTVSAGGELGDGTFFFSLSSGGC
jgi:hypothetical protein